MYLRPFPDAQRGVWRVSGSEGGIGPRWRADGRELFYFTNDRRLMSVTFDGAGPQPAIGRPQMLFESINATAQFLGVSSGERFLISQRRLPPGDVPVTVLTNWPELLANR